MKSVKSILGGRETITVERLTSITDAARLMAEHQIGAVPVVDGGRLVGIFSELTMLNAYVHYIPAHLSPSREVKT